MILLIDYYAFNIFKYGYFMLYCRDALEKMYIYRLKYEKIHEIN